MKDSSPFETKFWDLGQGIVALAMNRAGTYIALAMSDGSARLLPASDEAEAPLALPLHDGISLELAPDADESAFLSAGDDGKIFILDPGVDAPTLLAERKGKWIDHTAGGALGHRAFSSGKTLTLLSPEGREIAEEFLPSSVGGLCFSPSGETLAAGHYEGVTLFSLSAPDEAPRTLPWKGSHLQTFWSPDGTFVFSSMQENALHGWKPSATGEEKSEMHMGGYPAKITSFGFAAGGKYLATSGADRIVCWPFEDGGPWDKTPLMLGGTDGRIVTAVAPHPTEPLLAAGYEDGMIVLAPFDGRMEIMIHTPHAEPNARVLSLAWNAPGTALFAALENGLLMMFQVTKRR